jgi:hypothetical protein
VVDEASMVDVMLMQALREGDSGREHCDQPKPALWTPAIREYLVIRPQSGEVKSTSPDWTAVVRRRYEVEIRTLSGAPR